MVGLSVYNGLVTRVFWKTLGIPFIFFIMRVNNKTMLEILDKEDRKHQPACMLFDQMNKWGSDPEQHKKLPIHIQCQVSKMCWGNAMLLPSNKHVFRQVLLSKSCIMMVCLSQVFSISIPRLINDVLNHANKPSTIRQG